MFVRSCSKLFLLSVWQMTQPHLHLMFHLAAIWLQSAHILLSSLRTGFLGNLVLESLASGLELRSTSRNCWDFSNSIWLQRSVLPPPFPFVTKHDKAEVQEGSSDVVSCKRLQYIKWALRWASCTVYMDGKRRCCLNDPLMALTPVCLIFVCIVQLWFAHYSFRNLVVPLHGIQTVLSWASLGSNVTLLSYCSVQN